MADGIQGLGRPANTFGTKADELAKDKKAGLEVVSDNHQLQKAADEVILSPEVKEMMETSSFDAEKVAQIKQALAEGTYPVDAKQIAKHFSDFENLL